MAFVPYVGPRIIPLTVDILLHWTFQGNQCQNVWQAKYSTVPTKANLDALANAFGTQIASAIMPRVTDDVVFVDCVAKDIGAAGRFQGAYIFGPTYKGALGTDPLPASVAAHLLLRTAKTGRRFKGAKSISGFGETDISGNKLLNTILAMIAQIALTAVQTWVSGQFVTAVGSLPKMSAPGVVLAPAESNAVTSISAVDDNADSQKTRLNGRGR